MYVGALHLLMLPARITRRTLHPSFDKHQRLQWQLLGPAHHLNGDPLIMDIDGGGGGAVFFDGGDGVGGGGFGGG